MNPHSYSYLIFDKGTKNIQWRIDRVLNKYHWEKLLSASRKLNLDLSYYPVVVSTQSGLRTLISDPKL
jgi:hypothetical protein